MSGPEAQREQLMKLLDQRQHMLALFCELAGLEPYHEPRPVDEKLRLFCERLVDYIAAGHFTLYESFTAPSMDDRGLRSLSREPLQHIEDTTDIAVAFNDKYDESDHPLDLTRLSADLAMLGEALATRADSEDRLINALLADR